MSMLHKTTRRDFLNMSWSLGLGAVLPAALAGCGGSDRAVTPAWPGIPAETFVAPPMLTSACSTSR
jgi:hypothetical protein